MRRVRAFFTVRADRCSSASRWWRSGILILSVLIAACGDSDEPAGPAEQPLAITSIEPTSGKFGTVVTITGEGFSTVAAENVVTFNGQQAEVTSASATLLMAEVPRGAGTGPVAVNVGGETAGGPEFTYVETITVSTYAGTGEPGLADGPAENARFSAPSDVDIDADGNVYVADLGNHAIRKISPAGEVTTPAGPVDGTRGFEDGPGPFALFNGPSGLAVGADGNIHVADLFNFAIRQITPTGPTTVEVSTLAGDGTSAFSDGTRRFAAPGGVAADADGDVYVADNHGIRRVEPDGAVFTLAGRSERGSEDGSGSAAGFDVPVGVAVDAEGNVYVGDSGNHRIRRITPALEVTTLAGSGTSGFADGPGAGARFQFPMGVALDAAGRVYVADRANHRIRRVRSSGEVSTVAGDGVAGLVNGEGSQARFRNPRGLAVDADGHLYVADFGNSVIRKITIE